MVYLRRKRKESNNNAIDGGIAEKKKDRKTKEGGEGVAVEKEDGTGNNETLPKEWTKKRIWENKSGNILAPQKRTKKKKPCVGEQS